MRDQGLSRMAVVEQKCAAEVPLYVDGKRHREDFDGQAQQYRRVLEHLKGRTGAPAHLMAVCQPDPRLMSTLTLHPSLGRTFGCAGSPMDTEAAPGFLTDYARTLGPGYIDMMLFLFGTTVPDNQVGAGRRAYDGSLAGAGVLPVGHAAAPEKLQASAAGPQKRQPAGRRAPEGFLQLVQHRPSFSGRIHPRYLQEDFHSQRTGPRPAFHRGRCVRPEDYPGDVPLWALGGKQDDIAPLARPWGTCSGSHK